MTKKNTSERSDSSSWRFRREITLGTLVHLMAILIMLAVGWSNLQKELALIRHDLNQLIQTNNRLQDHIRILADQGREHEFRLQALESQREKG